MSLEHGELKNAFLYETNFWKTGNDGPHLRDRSPLIHCMVLTVFSDTRNLQGTVHHIHGCDILPQVNKWCRLNSAVQEISVSQAISMAIWNAHRSNSGLAVLPEENMAQKHNIRCNNSIERNENDEDENAAEKTEVRGKSIITETYWFCKTEEAFCLPSYHVRRTCKRWTHSHTTYYYKLQQTI